MPLVEFPLRQWLPDQADLNNQGVVVAENAYLSPKGYQPIREPGTDATVSLGPLTTTASGLHMFGRSYEENSNFRFGFIMVKRSSAIGHNETGSANDTFVFDSSFSRVNPDFDRFGDEIFIVSDSTLITDGPHDLFKYSIDSRTFSAVSGPIPAGRTIARVRNFLMMGGVSDDASDYSPYSFRWSGFNQPESWEPSARTQSGIAEIDTPSLGIITAIVGGDRPMIFQERGVTRIEYVGTPKVWAQQLISDAYGSLGHQSIVAVDDLHYFVSRDGVHVTDGSSVQTISTQKIRTVINEQLHAQDDFVYGSYHIEKRAIIWGIGGNTNAFSYVFGYCLDTDSFFEVDTSYKPTARGEVAQDTATTYGFSSTGAIAPLDGDTLAAEVTTGHISAIGKRTFVRGAEPQYKGSGATVALSAKDRLRDDGSFSAYAAEDGASGVVPFETEGRAIAASVKFAAAADWSDLTGVILDADEAGEA